MFDKTAEASFLSLNAQRLRNLLQNILIFPLVLIGSFHVAEASASVTVFEQNSRANIDLL
jgi:hypothetical protein